MYFSPAFFAAALPFLAAATPLKARQAPPSYSLVAIHSGDETVHNQPIVASNESFYIGKTSSALCGAPDHQTYCNAPTSIWPYNSTADLTVAVPGGQQIFVASSGALSYTPPHSHLIPASATSTGFQAVSSGGANSISNLAFGSAGESWLACPLKQVNSNFYHIYANVTNVQVPSASVADCHAVSVALMPANNTETPWQFD